MTTPDPRAAGDVSVVLATYNGAEYIAEQAMSIAAQSERPLEVVVCDDGSVDGTPEIAVTVLESAGIRVRRLDMSPRIGAAANFERGCRASVGRIIALCDQDDVWHSDKLERLMALLDAEGALLAASDARLIDGSGRELPGSLWRRLEISEADRRALASARGFEVLLRRNLVTGATAVFRRELMEFADPFGSLWVHDEWLAILAAAVGRIAVDPEPLIDYRLHGRNQIGAAEPTLAAKLRVVTAARGERTWVLARRSTELADRLDLLGGSAKPGAADSARAKAGLEATRSRLPRHRVARIPTIVRLMAVGAYTRYASRGRLDAVRDLLQHA